MAEQIATPSQISYITGLCHKLDLDPNVGMLTKREASSLIDDLRAKLGEVEAKPNGQLRTPYSARQVREYNDSQRRQFDGERERAAPLASDGSLLVWKRWPNVMRMAWVEMGWTWMCRHPTHRVTVRGGRSGTTQADALRRALTHHDRYHSGEGKPLA